MGKVVNLKQRNRLSNIVIFTNLCTQYLSFSYLDLEGIWRIKQFQLKMHCSCVD